MFSKTTAGPRNMGTQGDYKRCQRLHKFIGKKVKATQKLNTRLCKEQLKSFFLHACVKSNFQLLPPE
jgi:hypothetical protein